MTLPQVDHAPQICLPPPRDLGAADVRYVVCSVSADSATPREAVFLTAIARARQLVKTGTRRIVFLIEGDGTDALLLRSLEHFVSHAARSMPSRPVDFAVMPLAGAWVAQ